MGTGHEIGVQASLGAMVERLGAGLCVAGVRETGLGARESLSCIARSDERRELGP
jgi:hypothetical protein